MSLNVRSSAVSATWRVHHASLEAACLHIAGLDQGSLKTAFGVDPSIDITTYNAPQEFASDPTGPGGTFYKVCCTICIVLPVIEISQNMP